MGSNGPRYETQSGFYLGEKEGDSEADGYVSPLNDNILGLSDEDGGGFVTALEVDETALISIKASRVGHLYINEGAEIQNVMSMPYEPFMFSIPGPYVRDGLWINPGRNLEVHLSAHAQT